ncbi:MAG: hypothetical protein RR150_10840, partial [Clostridia bacterium]
ETTINLLENTSTDAITFDVNLVPDQVRDDLAATVLKSVRAYFRQPGTQEKFEKWLAERQAKKGGPI